MSFSIVKGGIRGVLFPPVRSEVVVVELIATGVDVTTALKLADANPLPAATLVALFVGPAAQRYLDRRPGEVCFVGVGLLVLVDAVTGKTASDELRFKIRAAGSLIFAECHRRRGALDDRVGFAIGPDRNSHAIANGENRDAVSILVHVSGAFSGVGNHINLHNDEGRWGPKPPVRLIPTDVRDVEREHVGFVKSLCSPNTLHADDVEVNAFFYF